MNIETTNINNQKNIQKTNNQTNKTEGSIKFSDELNELENSQAKTCNNEEITEIKKTDTQEAEKTPEDPNNKVSSEDEGNKPSDDKNLGAAIENLHSIMKELSQSDEKGSDSLKDDKLFVDENKKGETLINKDFNIQENKEILPQMNPNMNFSGDGQPFSSFMNNEQQNKNSSLQPSRNAKDLAEEAAILSTMAENIAIANKNNILKENITPQQEEIKTVHQQDGIKRIETKTNIIIENVVKYDSIIMNQADVEVFAQLVQNNEIDIKNLAPEAAKQSIQISKTLADMIAKSMETNQPLRIDFDNNISVIIRISRDGKISADFLPSSQVAEAYLKENLPLLRQRFDDNSIKYDELNQKERRENREQNRKKGRDNE